MRRLILLAALALAGCATAPKPPAPTPIASVQCLPLASYSKAEQTEAADELAKLPAGSVLGRMVTDYGSMRAADRACLKASP